MTNGANHLTRRAKKELLPLVFFETEPHLLRFLYETTSKTTGESVFLALSVMSFYKTCCLEVKDEQYEHHTVTKQV